MTSETNSPPAMVSTNIRISYKIKNIQLQSKRDWKISPHTTQEEHKQNKHAALTDSLNTHKKQKQNKKRFKCSSRVSCSWLL